MSQQERKIEIKSFERVRGIRPLEAGMDLNQLIPPAIDYAQGYICIETWNGIYWGRADGGKWIFEHEPPMDTAELHNVQVRAFNGTNEIYCIVGNRGILTRSLKRVESGGTEIPCFETGLILLNGAQEAGRQNGFSTYRHKTGASVTLPVSGKAEHTIKLNVCCLCAEHTETGALYINDQMYLNFQ
ncbi:MAG: hypothetical protein ACK5XN_35465 [Bacteroidota bacterium]|jgi:hypothetical protein